MHPPPQTASLHDPASQILELAISTTTTTAMATPTPARPYHRSTRPIDFTLVTMSTSTSALTTHIATDQTPPAALQGMATSLATSAMASTTTTPTANPLLEPSPNVLPDWPPILAIFLLSWLVMAWIVTIVLFLASFPEKVAWLDRRIKKWRDVGRGDRSDLPPSTDSMWNDRGSPTAEYIRSNGPSTAVTTGLGISTGSLTPRLRRPRSFDEESLKPRGWSFDSGSVASTAPLLPSRSFVDWTPKPNRRQRGGVGDWERGRTPKRNDGEDIPGIRDESPPGAHGIAGVLESVQAVVEFIAGRLAKMGSDEDTDGAESGLLLPVKDGERQTSVDVCGGC